MSTPDTRQRRPIPLSSPSYPPPTHSPGPASRSPTDPLRLALPLLTRLARSILSLVALTIALYILPTFIQHIAHSLSALSALTGRRARTAFEDIPASSVVVGVAVLAVWHGVLAGLSYYSVRRRDGSWGRVLGRVVVPGVLLGGLMVRVWGVVRGG